MYRKSFRKRFGYRKGYTYIYGMINELLAKRDVLAEIAEAMYGDFWVAEDDFWGSPTEQQMKEVELQLFNLGWTPDQPTDDQIAMGEIIFEEMKKKGKIS